MQIESTNGSYQQIGVEALAIAVFKDEKADSGFLKNLDSLTGGVVKSVIDSEELKGKEGESVYLHFVGNTGLSAQRLFLVGVGDRDDYSNSQASQMAGTAIRALRGKNVKSIAVVPRLDGNAEDLASMVVEGSLMALFDPDKYRTVDKEEREIAKLVVVLEGADEAAIKQGVERGKIIGESVNFTRDLANEPGGYLTPTNMAERARDVATDFGLSIDVLDEARMEQEGMGSLLSVSRGSDEPGKLIILKYTPAEAAGEAGELLTLSGRELRLTPWHFAQARGEHGIMK